MSKPINVPGYEGVVWHESNVNIERLKEIAKPRDQKAHEEFIKDYMEEHPEVEAELRRQAIRELEGGYDE